MAHHSSTSSSPDAYISYGIGGAGNMRRKSDIQHAWSILSTSPQSSPLTPTPSPEESKTSTSRRRSSTWSTSTSGGEHRSTWRRLSAVFTRRRSHDAGVLEKDEDEKIERKGIGREGERDGE